MRRAPRPSTSPSKMAARKWLSCCSRTKPIPTRGTMPGRLLWTWQSAPPHSLARLPVCQDSRNLSYPDFTRIKIHRPEPAKPGAQKEIPVNSITAGTNTFDCAKDMWLEFGDVVEIPERDHTLTEDFNYLNVWPRASLMKCLA